MKQALVVFHLREGAQLEAEKLAAADLPFDPEEAGFTGLAVYVTRGNLVEHRVLEVLGHVPL
jgi:hypothetical protein